MSDKPQPASPTILQPTTVPTNINLPGDGNTLIAHTNAVSMSTNTINVFVPSPQPNGVMLPTKRTLNTNLYNLFVIGDETFASGHFIVPKDRALTECMIPELKAKYAMLNEDAITAIKTLPSVFASENLHYGYTDITQQAYFGLVTDIKIQENGIKVHCQLLSAIPQQRLNEIAFNLAINGASSFNELNRTHWAIKHINLIEELKDAGISVLAPT